ncbi:hypothetical protein [Marinobacter salsuginis]|uniref:hypothetical protein n=1 Tax=Marinobacter salsuginis TaxID=418719 RepID=UPI001AE0A46E|nr:hypothetical protein [Marinobacter salsuginis]QTN43432.1 hypothetical protein HZ997_08900 [Marinobacter salsuginis]
MQARRRPLHCAFGSIPWARMLQALKGESMTSERLQGTRIMIVSACLMLLTLLLSDTRLPMSNMTLYANVWTVDVKVKDPHCLERNKPHMLVPRYRCEWVDGSMYQIQAKPHYFMIYTKYVLSVLVLVFAYGALRYLNVIPDFFKNNRDKSEKSLGDWW